MYKIETVPGHQVSYFVSDERQAKMVLNRIQAVSLKINVGET